MTAKHATDDVRIREMKELSPPAHLLREFPLRAEPAQLIYESRQAIHRILHGMDDRLLVIVGPCSIHDPVAALEYARLLVSERERLKMQSLVDQDLLAFNAHAKRREQRQMQAGTHLAWHLRHARRPGHRGG